MRRKGFEIEKSSDLVIRNTQKNITFNNRKNLHKTRRVTDFTYSYWVENSVKYTSKILIKNTDIKREMKCPEIDQIKSDLLTSLTDYIAGIMVTSLTESAWSSGRTVTPVGGRRRRIVNTGSVVETRRTHALTLWTQQLTVSVSSPVAYTAQCQLLGVAVARHQEEWGCRV